MKPVAKKRTCEANSRSAPDWRDVGKESVKVANIYATRNYEMFKFLPGNRNTNHARKIMASIKAVGILFQPILINEKCEIIEGQGRYVACKTLKLPVLYVMQKGIGIEECSKLNSVSTNWKMKDYIHRYAHGEDKVNNGAKYLENLIKEFPRYSPTLCYGFAVNAGFNTNGCKTASFKNGVMPMTEEEYQHGREVLSYLEKFDFVYKTIEGRIECIHGALAFFYSHPDVDNDFLYTQMCKRYVSIPPIANTRQAIEVIQGIYNFNARTKKQIYVISDYERGKSVRGTKNGNA